jgi:hypothetical protein
VVTVTSVLGMDEAREAALRMSMDFATKQHDLVVKQHQDEAELISLFGDLIIPEPQENDYIPILPCSNPNGIRYQYERLKGYRNIRLIYIQPGSSLSKVHIDLKENNLDEQGFPYVAISYTWEGQQADTGIICEGHDMLVTKNCEKILRELQQRGDASAFWIDAICIDQNSVSEKNIQVPMMGDIYSRATGSFIWLDCDVWGKRTLQLLAECKDVLRSHDDAAQKKKFAEIEG